LALVNDRISALYQSKKGMARDGQAIDRWQEEGACTMLVLSRHRDESIIIGDDIVITVVDIRGDKVRLGIAAPIEISVHRQEVYEAIQRENRQASRLEPQEARQVEAVRGPLHREFRRNHTEA